MFAAEFPRLFQAEAAGQASATFRFRDSCWQVPPTTANPVHRIALATLIWQSGSKRLKSTIYEHPEFVTDDRSIALLKKRA